MDDELPSSSGLWSSSTSSEDDLGGPETDIENRIMEFSLRAEDVTNRRCVNGLSQHVIRITINVFGIQFTCVVYL